MDLKQIVVASAMVLIVGLVYLLIGHYWQKEGPQGERGSQGPPGPHGPEARAYESIDEEVLPVAVTGSHEIVLGGDTYVRCSLHGEKSLVIKRKDGEELGDVHFIVTDTNDKPLAYTVRERTSQHFSIEFADSVTRADTDKLKLYRGFDFAPVVASE